jgi:pyruvate/2-oxoglutarate dehydrogenase complex dihydrolipoamide acyltransferase (E2) component
MSGDHEEGRVSPQGVPISEIIPLAAMRKMAAEHMIKSHLNSARVTVMEEMDVDGFVALRNDLAEDPEKTGGIKISYTHLFIKAIAQALGEHRVMNSTLVDNEIQVLADINIGMAVALPDGNLIVPVIHQADRLSLSEIAQRAADLQERAKINKLVLDDVRKGTFTLTNIGMLPESRWTTPIINQPQCAILGTGAIRQAAVVRDGQLAVGWVVSMSLTFDHRIVNGLPASLFLHTLSELLKNPNQLELGI